MDNIWIILGTLATTILAILSFIQWRNSKTTLSVEIRKYPYKLPKQFLETLKTFRTNFNYPGYTSKDASGERKNESEDCLKLLSTQINDYGFNEIFPPSIVEYIQLKNTGNNEITNIKITIDNLMFYLPSNNDWSKKNNSIVIPVIQPNEKIDLKVWSQGLRINRPSIVMSKGRATIVTYKMVPSNIANTYKAINKNKYYLLFNIILIIAVILLSMNNYVLTTEPSTVIAPIKSEQK